MFNGSSGWASGFQCGSVVALGVQDGEHDRLVVNHLIEHGVRKPSEIGPAPVAKADTVAEGIRRDDVNDTLHLIHELRAESQLSGAVPARFALNVRLSERMASGRVHP